MNKLNIDIENCYGIKKLEEELDFSQHKAYAIYAANGAMKTSLAQTFKDIAEAAASKDRIFPDRVSKRKITDENGVDLSKESVYVIRPYDDGVIGHTEKTSTLLVDSKLRKEYEELGKVGDVVYLLRCSLSSKEPGSPIKGHLSKDNWSESFFLSCFRTNALLTQEISMVSQE